MKLGRPSSGLVVAVIALIAATSGSAVAASLITSKQIKDGTVQLKDISKKARASLRGQKGALGPRGDSGAQGAQGLKGDNGAQGLKGDNGDNGAPGAPGQPATRLWAAVQSSGNLLRSSGVTAAACVNDPCSGFYGVTFDRDVSECAWQATTGTVDGSLLIQPRNVGVAQNLAGGFFNQPNQILVATFDAAGASVSSDFFLTVFC